MHEAPPKQTGQGQRKRQSDHDPQQKLEAAKKQTGLHWQKNWTKHGPEEEFEAQKMMPVAQQELELQKIQAARTKLEAQTQKAFQDKYTQERPSHTVCQSNSIRPICSLGQLENLMGGQD